MNEQKTSSLIIDQKRDATKDVGLSVDNSGPRPVIAPQQSPTGEIIKQKGIENLATPELIPAHNKVKKGMKYNPETKKLEPDYGDGTKEPNSGRTWEQMQKDKANREALVEQKSVHDAKVANSLTNKQPDQNKIGTITKENPPESHSLKDILTKK